MRVDHTEWRRWREHLRCFFGNVRTLHIQVGPAGKPVDELLRILSKGKRGSRCRSAGAWQVRADTPLTS